MIRHFPSSQRHSPQTMTRCHLTKNCGVRDKAVLSGGLKVLELMPMLYLNPRTATTALPTLERRRTSPRRDAAPQLTPWSSSPVNLPALQRH
jgi:hypothetical protein